MEACFSSLAAFGASSTMHVLWLWLSGFYPWNDLGASLKVACGVVLIKMDLFLENNGWRSFTREWDR